MKIPTQSSLKLMKRVGVSSSQKLTDSSIMSTKFKLLQDQANVKFNLIFTDNYDRSRPKTQSKDLMRSSIG